MFGSQRGGRRTGPAPAVVSGSALSFAPTAYPFLPGEAVQATVTTAVAGSGGALARPRVVQFTAATGGTGQANFLPSAAIPDIVYAGSGARSAGVFDFDGDGDMLVLVYRQNQYFVTILLNQPGTVVSGTRPGAYPTFALAPNPARSAAALTGAVAHAAVEVTDVLGRVVLVAKADALGAAKLVLPAGLPAGVYMVRSGRQVGRLVIE